MQKGYIEGYYGRLFSKEEREIVVSHMGNLKMDFYIYGPKEAPYHRLIGTNYTLRGNVKI